MNLAGLIRFAGSSNPKPQFMALGHATKLMMRLYDLGLGKFVKAFGSVNELTCCKRLKSLLLNENGTEFNSGKVSEK